MFFAHQLEDKKAISCTVEYLDLKALKHAGKGTRHCYATTCTTKQTDKLSTTSDCAKRGTSEIARFFASFARSVTRAVPGHVEINVTHDSKHATNEQSLAREGTTIQDDVKKASRM